MSGPMLVSVKVTVTEPVTPARHSPKTSILPDYLVWKSGTLEEVRVRAWAKTVDTLAATYPDVPRDTLGMGVFVEIVQIWPNELIEATPVSPVITKAAEIKALREEMTELHTEIEMLGDNHPDTETVLPNIRLAISRISRKIADITASL